MRYAATARLGANCDLLSLSFVCAGCAAAAAPLFIPARPMSSINTPLLYSTYSREPRPELDERRAEPPRLELGHAPHELLEVRLRDVLEVVEVARHVEDRGPKLRRPVRLDPVQQALLSRPRTRRSSRS